MPTPTVLRRENPRFRERAITVIVGRIADGKSLRSICRKRHMPNKRTVMDWLAADQQFQMAYNLAYREREQVFFEDMVEIADTESNSKRARVRIYAREKTLAAMNPKKYGNRIQQEITGPNGGPVEVVRLRMAPVPELPE